MKKMNKDDDLQTDSECDFDLDDLPNSTSLNESLSGEENDRMLVQNNEETTHDAREQMTAKRGPSRGKKQVNKRKRSDGKTKVDYNEFGVPTGANADYLATLVGVLARSAIPITYHDWRKVPLEIKNRIWETILFQYELHERSKSQVLQSVGVAFRNFKYALKARYITPNLSDRRKLFTPPSKLYPSITKEDWVQFVKERMTEKFKEESGKAKERRAKNRFNHRLSRRGYRGLLEDVCTETGLSEVDIDRSELWKRGRKKKNGDFDPSVLPIVQAIDKLQQEAKEGSFKADGKRDILATAIGKLPTKGHMQGTGKFLPASHYYHLHSGMHYCQASSSITSWQQEIEARIEDLTRMLKSSRRQSEIGSCSVAQKLNREDNEETKQRLKVAGDGGEEPNPNKEDSDREKDDKGDGKNEKKFEGKEIQIPRKSPRLNQEKQDDNNVKGNKLRPLEEKKKAVRARKELEFDNTPNKLKNEVAIKKAKGKQTAQPRRTRGVANMKQSTTPILSLFGALVHLKFPKAESDPIVFPIDYDVYGIERTRAYIGLAECQSFLRMDWLHNSVIESYSAMLYESSRNTVIDGQVPTFSFIHPSVVYPRRKSDCAKPAALVEDRARSVADRLLQASKGQYYFMVYNPFCHWVLVVVNVSSKEIFYVDPLNNDPDPDLKDLIDISMKVVAAQDGVQWSYNSMVKNVQCPQQPGGSECGYYVLRFMVDIMTSIDVLHNNFNGKASYTQEEIDLVRDEWALQITSLIRPAG